MHMLNNVYTNFLLILVSCSYLNAENILDIYNEALENDPTYKAAEYSYLADKQILVQGRAALLPSLTLSGSTNWNEYYQNDELQQEYNSFSKSARLTQPLFRLDTWFNFKRSKSLTNAAEADFGYQQQNLLLRTAELYFGVLRAIDNLNAAISEEKAIKKQLDQAQQRYEVGLSAITGVQEAQLAYDLSRASRINNEGNLFSAREALNALIGREIFSLDELGDDLSVSSPYPNSKEDWVKTALEGFEINGQGIPVPSVTGRRKYAIQMSIPIFQGGAVSSRRKQAYSQYNEADENSLFTERRVIQEVRSQFSNVVTLVANVEAQQQAVISATSALEATQVGYKVGTRNIVDLLQAEKNLYSAEKNLANAKYDYILANLRLALAAGTISPSDIVEINNLLKLSNA